MHNYKTTPTDAVRRCLDIIDSIIENPRDTLSDVPHYKLEEAITDMLDILTDARLTINESE